MLQAAKRAIAMLMQVIADDKTGVAPMQPLSSLLRADGPMHRSVGAMPVPRNRTIGQGALDLRLPPWLKRPHLCRRAGVPSLADFGRSTLPESRLKGRMPATPLQEAKNFSRTCG